MKVPLDENVLVGLGTADDAGVYQITPDLALIQTVDFFTPIVDDPFDFGRIAAANALSDVYAMGGVPKTAMNLVAFPLADMDHEVLHRILAGGIQMLEEAETVLLGGHSIEDPKLKYGLSVTGTVHPNRILANQGLKTGDRLVLTKPVGTGVINTAVKAGLADGETIERVTHLMATLNKNAALAMDQVGITACTDVTGFGLLGHLAEMVAGTPIGAVVYGNQVPLMPHAEEFAAMGMVPGGAFRNRRFREDMVTLSPDISPILRDLFFDPQTSGGLLMGCPGDQVKDLLAALAEFKVMDAAVIGEIRQENPGGIEVVNA